MPPSQKMRMWRLLPTRSLILCLPNLTSEFKQKRIRRQRTLSLQHVKDWLENSQTCGTISQGSLSSRGWPKTILFVEMSTVGVEEGHVLLYFLWYPPQRVGGLLEYCGSLAFVFSWMFLCYGFSLNLLCFCVILLDLCAALPMTNDETNYYLGYVCSFQNLPKHFIQ